MPDYTDAPTADDIIAVLQLAGLYPADTTLQGLLATECADAGAAALVEFEKLTGWQPFLSDGSVSSRTYTRGDIKANGVLDLRGGVVNIGNTGNVPVITSAYGTGPATTLATTAYLFVQSDPRFLCYDGIRLGSGCGNWNSWGYGDYGGGDADDSFTPSALQYTVTAQFGYCIELPPDVFKALTRRGAAIALELLTTANNGIESSRTQEGLSRTFDAGLKISERIAKLESSLEEVARSYLRITA